MIKKTESFARILPKVTQFAEKPMAQWASGKIKRIYDGYGSFCDEIERLLGEPQEKPHVSHGHSPEMLDEFDFLWQDQKDPLGNGIQLLTLLSSFYRAGFVVRSRGALSSIESYFCEDNSVSSGNILGRQMARVTPPNTNLKPASITPDELFRTMGVADFSGPEDLTVHFWLDPDQEISLIVISDAPEPKRREILLKTQALIQRRFYD